MATILIVDDEPEVVEIIRFRLEQDSHTVISATDGQSGLVIAFTRRPDLIILDVMMPGVDGFEVLRQLKSDQEAVNIPVVMLTAKGNPFAQERGRALNVDRYLVKPFDLDNLAQTVQTVLADRDKAQPA